MVSTMKNLGNTLSRATNCYTKDKYFDNRWRLHLRNTCDVNLRGLKFIGEYSRGLKHFCDNLRL